MGAHLASVDEAAAIVGRGGLVVVPTETVYGLATRPQRESVDRIFSVKRRPPDKSVQLLVADASWLQRLGDASPAARALAEAFWPGPLTLVVLARERAPAAVVFDGTIGLRAPDHPIALDLIARTGPLAASSANRTTEPTPPTVEEIFRVFEEEVDAYIDGGRIEGDGSTVVDVTGVEPKVLRTGPLPEDAISAAVEGSI